jgi:RimJ/RimL family protein N-acetyltransferase
MIELRPFEETDIPRLIAWIPDARFLLQWAGPQYKFPLDAVQLHATLETTKGDHPSHFMFTALQKAEGEVVGHIELMKVDYDTATAVLGRVLIGRPEWRARGFGRRMVEEAMRYAFDTLNLGTVTLGVFDFNIQAIACYHALGFAEYERNLTARQFGDEYWNLIMMRLDRDTWRAGSQLRTSQCTVPATAGQ